MKSRSLLNSFLSHVESHPDSFDRTLTNAIVYGTDEFKIKFHKKSIKLEGTGWIPCDGIQDKDAPDWVALFWSDGKVVIDFGNGDPYVKYQNGYVYKETKYNLVPYKMTLNQ